MTQSQGFFSRGVGFQRRPFRNASLLAPFNRFLQSVFKI
jgi:hypothetical protein